MNERPQILLEHHLKALKLATFLREYDKVSRQCAGEGVGHPDFLLRLSELEVSMSRRTCTYSLLPALPIRASRRRRNVPNSFGNSHRLSGAAWSRARILRSISAR